MIIRFSLFKCPMKDITIFFEEWKIQWDIDYNAELAEWEFETENFDINIFKIKHPSYFK